MADTLPNYLKTYRKRAGLSQEELADVIGSRGPENISRYERGTRSPDLETALAFQAALDVPVAELFAGTYEKVEQEVADRAEALADEIEADGPKERRKLEALAGVREPAAAAGTATS